MNVLFLIHGIGRHGAAWSDEPVAALNEAMKLYPECFPPGKTLADYVLPVEIRYDDIFDSVLERWKQLAASLPAPAGAFNWTAEVTRLLKQAGDDGNTFARYGGDILLYCGFALVARAARLRVNSVIASTMYRAHAEAVAAGGNVPSFAVICHSMGTAVAQDALQQLAIGRWVAERQELEQALPDLVANANLSPRQAQDLAATLDGLRADPARSVPVKLNALFLISDTSPLLHQAPLYSELKNSRGGYDCAAVWSVNHELDPVSRVGAGPAGAVARADKTNVSVRHIHKENIHDLAHYLSHPAVHGAIFRRLVPAFGNACFQKAQQLAASPDWTGFGGELAGLPAAARQKLQDALKKAIPIERSVQKLRETIEGYFRAVGLLP